MVRVYDIVIAILFTGKGYQETVCQALIQIFGTVVHSPFKTFDVLIFPGKALNAITTRLMAAESAPAFQPNMTTCRNSFLSCCAFTQREVSNTKDMQIEIFLMVILWYFSYKLFFFSSLTAWSAALAVKAI